MTDVAPEAESKRLPSAENEIEFGSTLGSGTNVSNRRLLRRSQTVIVFLLGWATYEKKIPWKIATGAAPFVLALFAYKQWIGVPNDIMSVSDPIRLILNPGRWAFVFKNGFQIALQFGGGALPIVALCAYIWKQKYALKMPLLATIVSLSGFLIIYIISPNELDWHMNTSFDRLLWQLFPTLTYLISGRNPNFIGER